MVEPVALFEGFADEGNGVEEELMILGCVLCEVEPVDELHPRPGVVGFKVRRTDVQDGRIVRGCCSVCAICGYGE